METEFKPFSHGTKVVCTRNNAYGSGVKFGALLTVKKVANAHPASNPAYSFEETEHLIRHDALLAEPAGKAADIEGLVLDHGKYTFRLNHDDGSLICLRSGKPWREFVGDKAVHELFYFALEAIAALRAMERARETPMVDDDFPELLHIADGLMKSALGKVEMQK